MIPRIDSHHHVWRLARGDYGWLTPAEGVLYRDFEPAEFARHLAVHQITGSVLVQAAPTEAETHFLLDIAAETPWVKGVIGWTDFSDPAAADRIAALAIPALKGLRPMLQDLVDDRFILRDAARPTLAAMAATGLCFDALIRPHHLPLLVELRTRHPDLPIVIDHAAKPPIASGEIDAYAAALRAVAADGITCCKLSGLITEAGPAWSSATLRPWTDLILDAFGPERVMWGSDWPVVGLAASYDRWVAVTEELLHDLDPAGRAAVLGGTATRFYGLEV